MSVGLLDVNMLIALAWPSHVHHQVAQTWFSANQSRGWATCPMTQCAFVRISSNQRIIPDAVQPQEALTLLGEIVALKHHRFWPDSISLTNILLPAASLVGHRQVTDAYLLSLSIHQKGKLITLDQGIAALLPPGSPHRSALEIVPTEIPPRAKRK
ncbi:MAG: VapC toxin family PIN domain ribonuclease [Candidatus Hydrogenedentes bacterium]|nr:VapC toxin family PIN domain ribonuclease [Candidatus Hydrogenedentota bacterium]